MLRSQNEAGSTLQSPGLKTAKPAPTIIKAAFYHAVLITITIIGTLMS